jgi:hypothetical protein
MKSSPGASRTSGHGAVIYSLSSRLTNRSGRVTSAAAQTAILMISAPTR